MATFTRTITVNAPVETVFTFMRDPAKRWGTGRHLEVSDVRMTPEGVGTTHPWKGKILGITLIGGTNMCTSKSLVDQSSTGPVDVDGGTREWRCANDLDMDYAPANWAVVAFPSIMFRSHNDLAMSQA